MTASQQLLTAVASAHNAARDAEQYDGKRSDFSIHAEYPDDGLTHGSVVIGIRCPKDGDAVRMALLCAFGTDWSNLIDKVEVFDLNPEERGVTIGLRNISNSVNFLLARLQTAARCIGAAATTISGVECVGTSPLSPEKFAEKMRENFPGIEAVRQRIVLRVVGTATFLNDKERCSQIMSHLERPEEMPAEVFAQLLSVGSELERQLATRTDKSPSHQATMKVLMDAIDRSPWMMIPGETIARKDRHTERPLA